MASGGDITIKLSDDAVEIFHATRIISCCAIRCMHNMARFKDSGAAECGYKHVYILKDGKCEQFKERHDAA